MDPRRWYGVFRTPPRLRGSTPGSMSPSRGHGIAGLETSFITVNAGGL